LCSLGVLKVLALVTISGCAGAPAANTKSAGAESLPENLPPQTSHTAKLGEPCVQARFESSCQEPFSCTGTSDTDAKGICFAVQKIGHRCDRHLYRCPQFTQECPPGHNEAACQSGVCTCLEHGTERRRGS